ncbi:recombinase family protein [Streptomyces sp. NPDC058613]|uniref:recombinase family protein n=1 Tax=Streptomyces sp. NPDC058613 TaxID=3346556 RepID=UPI0036596FE8
MVNATPADVPTTFLSAAAIESVAVSYVRQSSAKADKSEASPLTQRSTNESEAVTRQARFLRHYEDIGVSGWDPDAYREGFEEMLKAARAGAFNMLIVYDVSRFSRREVMDAIPIVGELHRLGITIISVMDGTFAPRDTMALIYLIMRLDAVNKESEHKSRKVRDVKAAQRAEGSWLGGQTPYGFDAERYLKGKLSLMRLVHNQKEAANLRRIVALILKHKDQPVSKKKGERNPGTLSSICDAMTAEGVMTRGQRKGKDRATSNWGVKTLKWILLNPAIAGMRADPIYKVRENGTRTSTLIGYRIHRDEEGRPGMAWEPIIQPAQWFELREWLMSRGRGEGVARGTSLLSGLRNADRKPILLCECGRPNKAQNSGVKPVYVCTRGTNVPTVPGEHQAKNSVMQSHLDDYVAQCIFSVIQDATRDDASEETMDIVIQAARVFSKSLEQPETAAERTEVVTERADAQNALRDLYDDLDAGLYSGEIGRERFIEKKTRIDARISAAEARLETLSDPEIVELPFDEWLNSGEGGNPIGKGSWWDTADLADKRKLVEVFVRKIVVNPTKNAHSGRVRGGYDVTKRIELEFVQPKRESESEAA